MNEDEYREAVIAEIVRCTGWPKNEAANVVGDLDDILEPMVDGLSPVDCASEILAAAAEDAQ